MNLSPTPTFVMIAGVTLLLAGCTSALSPDRAADVNLKEKGFVLATWEHEASPAAVVGIHVEAPIHRVDAQAHRFLDPAITSRDRVWLVALPPGRYAISDWSMRGALDNAAAPPQRFEFEVHAGEITYLGNFDLAVELRGKPGKRRATRGWLLLDDQYAKAVAEFERAYPILAAMPVRDGAPQRFVWNQWPAQERSWSSDSGMNDYHPWGIPLPQNNPLWP